MQENAVYVGMFRVDPDGGGDALFFADPVADAARIYARRARDTDRQGRVSVCGGEFSADGDVLDFSRLFPGGGGGAEKFATDGGAHGCFVCSAGVSFFRGSGSRGFG